MRNKGILLFSLIVIAQSVASQIAPKWVNPMQRDQTFPSKEYAVGFVSQSYQKEENPDSFKDKVKGAARAALSESIFVSIKSESSSQLSNQNGNSDDRYQKNTVTSSSLDAIGMKVEDYVDTKKRVVYCFAYVKRRSLISHYYGQLSSEMGRIESALKRNNNITDKTEAYKRHSNELEALNTAKEYQTMLKYLNVSSEVVLMTSRWKQAYDATLDAIDKLRNNDDIGIKEASYFLVDKLKDELGGDVGTIHMGLVTYKSTGIPTEFSDYFGHLFREALEEKRGSISRSINKDGYVVSGTYWPGEKEFQIIANVNYVVDDEVINRKAGGSISVDIGKVDRLGVEYELEEQEETIDKNEKLRPTSPIGGLVANLTTQKGSQSIIMNAGELLSLYVSVSRPSYIRIINIWSDNQKFLLADNYYVNPDQTNQSIKLPLSWETSCPCGVEYLQMVAQDQPFEPLETVDKDGFLSIKGTLSSLLTKTRSMKMLSEYFAESTLVLTTIE